MTTDPSIRFWRLVAVGGPDECWPWLGAINPQHGYGAFRPSARRQDSMVQAHRFAWADRRGPIPEGLTVDHLCFNRRCQNPGHMEIVTRSENSRRGARKRWDGHVRTPPERGSRPRRRSRGLSPEEKEVYRHVEQRDGSCVAPAVDPGVDLCEGPIHREHVRYAAAMGGRRITTRNGVVLLCRRHHMDGWATSHKPELRLHLAKVEPQE